MSQNNNQQQQQQKGGNQQQKAAPGLAISANISPNDVVDNNALGKNATLLAVAAGACIALRFVAGPIMKYVFGADASAGPSLSSANGNAIASHVTASMHPKQQAYIAEEIIKSLDDNTRKSIVDRIK